MPGDGVRPDPRLEAALRHAPDAEVSAPPLLRARIIAAAQRSAEEARLRRPWWRRLDGRLTPWRMGGAGTAAAALLAATVLWVGRDELPAEPEMRPLPDARSAAQDMPQGMPQGGATASSPAAAGRVTTPPAEGAAAMAAAEAPPTVTPAAPAAPTRLARAPTAASVTAAPPARLGNAVPAAAPSPSPPMPPGAPAPAAAAAARPVPAPAVDAARERTDRMADRASRDAGDEDAARAEQRTRARAAESARQGAPVTSPSASPSPSPSLSPGPSPAPAPTPTPALAVARETREPVPAEADAGVRRLRAEASSAAIRAPAAPAPAPFAAALPAQREAVPSTRDERTRPGALALSTSSPLAADWLAATGDSAWRRRGPGGDEAALPAGWLAELVAAGRGRWSAAPAGAAAQGEAWTLFHPGAAGGRVLWIAGAVIVCDARGTRCEQAPVGEAARASLRDALMR